MIHDNFGPYIDIHGGGMDLRFPHHENETAQARALYGTSLANFWMHNAMINFGGKKMSKSLGNVKWAKDVIADLGPNLTRWFMLSVNYRKELQFSDETIDTARKELEKVMNPLHKAYIKCELADYELSDEYDSESYEKFLEAMNDDMNTPNAYAAIFDTVKSLNQLLRVREVNFPELNKYIISVEKMLDILGIVVERVKLDDEDRELYAGWNAAKAAKDFDEADKFRNKLVERGKM